MLRNLTRILAAAASAATLTAYARYRAEMHAIREALDAGSSIAETDAGDIEYADRGEGEPVLVVHGAGGGYDQGLLIGRDLGDGFRVIAPSRFGYLKTAVPDDASLEAQANAHAALLEFLGIERAVVLAASAGAPSAIDLALLHPERVSALILLAPRAYDPSQSVGVDQSASSQAVLSLVEKAADFPFWLAVRLQRSAVLRFLGVKPCVEARASRAEQQRVDEVIRSILPLSKRMKGLAVDSTTEIKPWPLEEMKVPTLVISATDDLYKTLPGARFTAEHIPHAELHVFDSGGHLMVGRSDEVQALIADFLQCARRPKPKHERRVAKVWEPVT